MAVSARFFFGIWRQAFSKVLSCSCTKAHGFNLLFFGTLGFFSLFSLFSFVAWGFKIKLLTVLTSLNLWMKQRHKICWGLKPAESWQKMKTSQGEKQKLLKEHVSRIHCQAQRDRENHRKTVSKTRLLAGCDCWTGNTGLKLSPQPFNLSCFLSDVFFANRHASKQTWPSGIDLQTILIGTRYPYSVILTLINLYYLYQSDISRVSHESPNIWFDCWLLGSESCDKHRIWHCNWCEIRAHS